MMLDIKSKNYNHSASTKQIRVEHICDHKNKARKCNNNSKVRSPKHKYVISDTKSNRQYE